MSRYKRRGGDRKEGRLLRSISPFSRFLPYIMRDRSDAFITYDESFEISSVDKKLRSLRVAGYRDMSFLHFFIAAYIRIVSMLPGLNRFVAGNHIYARDTIDIVFITNHGMSVDSQESTIKIQFQPSDTIFDVYRKINEKLEDMKVENVRTVLDDLTDSLARAPRPILRFALWFLRFLDRFGWLPENILRASPFHSSLMLSDLTSKDAIRPISHHLYNFGTLPLFICFGSKYHKYEPDRYGQVFDNKYIDAKIVFDERIAEGESFAQFLRAFRYIVKHPEILDKPPTRVVEDIR